MTNYKSTIGACPDCGCELHWVEESLGGVLIGTFRVCYEDCGWEEPIA